MHDPSSDQAPPPGVYTGAVPSAPLAVPLQDGRHVAAAVIGGGFTGMSTALHLAEAGVEVAVLEAKDVGWGASGRAFGQVVPYLKRDHTTILRHYGAEHGQRVVDGVADGPSLVFDLIEHHRIECWPVRTGLIFAAHAPSGTHELAERTAYWQQRGAPVELLEGEACAALTGSHRYPAASLDRRGGHLNPFAYVRGLARAAAAAGATVHTATPVHGLRREGTRWVLQSGDRRLTADSVVIATNAYTGGLLPRLRASIIPMRGHGFVTEPLSDNVRHTILPHRQALTDTRHLFSAVRLLPDGRLHASTYGPAFGPEDAPDWRFVDDRVRRLFPQLGAPRWSEAWSGWVAMTTDHFPRLHELAPGLFAGLGYNGRGIAAATIMGRDLAALVRGAGDAATVFPLVPLRPQPWHRATPAMVRALVQAYRVQDSYRELRYGRSRW
ncbi:MAG TPA: FAD-binding oxidoreductase [Acetobacteraceae bacterium]|nr:FAD-binding oxidoreductase [Acetobacteraceae bacterium]